jgi:hypothetical protein
MPEGREAASHPDLFVHQNNLPQLSSPIIPPCHLKRCGLSPSYTQVLQKPRLKILAFVAVQLTPDPKAVVEVGHQDICHQ